MLAIHQSVTYRQTRLKSRGESSTTPRSIAKPYIRESAVGGVRSSVAVFGGLEKSLDSCSSTTPTCRAVGRLVQEEQGFC